LIDARRACERRRAFDGAGGFIVSDGERDAPDGFVVDAGGTGGTDGAHAGESFLSIHEFSCAAVLFVAAR